MKMFATELRDKMVMSAEGKYIGTLDNCVVDTNTGKVHHILLYPAEDVDPSGYRQDSQGRIVLPFNKVKSAKDVIVLAPLD